MGLGWERLNRAEAAGIADSPVLPERSPPVVAVVTAAGVVVYNADQLADREASVSSRSVPWSS